MAKAKDIDAVEFPEVLEAPAVKTVKIFSLRQGDVVLQDGQILKYRQTIEVNEETATWLEVSFKELVQRV